VLVLPNQTPELIEPYGLTRAQVDAQVWAVDAAGRKWGGAAAVNRVMAELGGVWRGLAAVYGCALCRWAEDGLYHWIAAHRGWLS